MLPFSGERKSYSIAEDKSMTFVTDPCDVTGDKLAQIIF